MDRRARCSLIADRTCPIEEMSHLYDPETHSVVAPHGTVIRLKPGSSDYLRDHSDAVPSIGFVTIYFR
jgi:hypothetical protein